MLFSGLIFSQQSPSFYHVSAGFSQGMGAFSEFSEGGSFGSMGIEQRLCKGLGVGLNVQHQSFKTSEGNGSSHRKWQNSGLVFNTSYQLERGKAFLKLSAGLGLATLSIPQITEFYPGSSVVVKQVNAGKISALNGSLGLSIGWKLCSALYLDLSAGLQGLPRYKLDYQERDVTGARDATGAFNPLMAEEIPFQTKEMNFSSSYYGIGLVWRPNAGQRATDYNSSRSNRSTSRMHGGGGGTRATDYNSSRSNKNGSGLNPIDTNSGGGTRATEYNSSRSNKNGSGLNPVDTNSGGGSRATDYNSSRSNKNGSGLNPLDTNSGGGTRATDYNSSRSNKNGSGLNPIDTNTGGGTRATDYNSSRSNRSTGISLENTDDSSERIQGQLLGLLASKRSFEFRADDGSLILGKIAKSFSVAQMLSIQANYTGKYCTIELSSSGRGRRAVLELVAIY